MNWWKDRKANMFNRKASDPHNRPDEVLRAIGIKQGQTIADIGSGGGYFAVQFAKAIGPSGRVYACDLDADFLDFLRRYSEKEGVTNLTTVHITRDVPDISNGSVDIIFMRNVVHHIKERTTYFRSTKHMLKPNGRLCIIDYDGRGRFFSFWRKFGHKVRKEEVIKEVVSSGFHLLQDHDFLPEQLFLVFSPIDTGAEK